MSVFNNPTKPNCSTLMSSCNCYFIKGCTTPSADNYNPLAECDDGSCVFTSPGCLDNTADNFNQYANLDDGSCVFNTGNSYNNGNLECWILIYFYNNLTKMYLLLIYQQVLEV